MIGLLRRRLGRGANEDGMTLVELLVASGMSIVLVGAVGSMMVSALKSQPKLSEQSQSISSARWVMERMTREIRNGVKVDLATTSKVSFLTYVRHTTCGSTTAPSSGTPAIKCQVTYECTTTYCSRIEANEGVQTGTAQKIFAGTDSSNVFCYVPSTSSDSLSCGTASSVAGTTYVGVKLHIPNPSGNGGGLTISDGASMRNATLTR